MKATAVPYLIMGQHPLFRRGIILKWRVKTMKAKELIAFLENFDEEAEIEIEVHDPASDEIVDSTFDIGIGKESSHPVLAISR